jgi:hypothetical protein
MLSTEDIMKNDEKKRMRRIRNKSWAGLDVGATYLVPPITLGDPACILSREV